MLVGVPGAARVFWCCHSTSGAGRSLKEGGGGRAKGGTVGVAASSSGGPLEGGTGRPAGEEVEGNN